MIVPATSLNKETGSALVVRNWEVRENIGFLEIKLAQTTSYIISFQMSL